MDSFELNFERVHTHEMEFLKSASPEDWHRYAYNHNWNDPLYGLFWIVSQPNCDMATALLIFWKGEPTAYDYETEEEKMGDDIYAVAPMLKYISKRFNTTGYTRSKISYDFLEDHGIDMPEYHAMCKAGRLRDIELLIERQKDVADPLVKLHPNMKLLKIAGRKVGGYDEDGFDGAKNMESVLFDSFGFFCCISGLGFAVAYLRIFAVHITGISLYGLAGLLAVAYCLYATYSNLRSLQSAVGEQGRQLSSIWIKITATIAGFAGFAIGHLLVLDPPLTLSMRISKLGIIIVALLGSSYVLTRILMHRAIRWT
jgi:Domain of unknown function (DUF4274)